MFKTDNKVTWEPGAQDKLLNAGNKITYAAARKTLDITYQSIPLSNQVGSGKLRQTSMAGGVKGSNGKYYIGSYTDYASSVWDMPESTNWSTSGTFGRWYEKVFNTHAAKIMKDAIEEGDID